MGGILGWERVDRLAIALLDLSGLCVTNSEAREIQHLYDKLLEFDKKPLVFKTQSAHTHTGSVCKKPSNWSRGDRKDEEL